MRPRIVSLISQYFSFFRAPRPCAVRLILYNLVWDFSFNYGRLWAPRILRNFLMNPTERTFSITQGKLLIAPTSLSLSLFHSRVKLKCQPLANSFSSLALHIYYIHTPKNKNSISRLIQPGLRVIITTWNFAVDDLPPSSCARGR